MSIDKKLNLDYNGTIPYVSGDRYYPQDKVRDSWFLQDQLGLVFNNLVGQNSFIISGGIVTQGAATDELNISACIGYVKYQVEIPNTFAATPPSKMSADVETKRVASTTQTNLDVSGTWNNDNSTVNYVKLAYSETNGNTRDRAKAAGNYNYEKVPSFTITVSDVAPTAYQIELARFITEGGNMPEYFDYSNRTASIQDYLNLSNLNEMQKNAVSNPEFAIAQRGVLFNGGTTPANDDDQVLLDRWILLSDGNDRVDVSQVTDAPTGSNYSMKSDYVGPVGPSVKWGYFHIIENENAVSFDGKTVSLSFQAKTTNLKEINKIRAMIVSWTGAADVPTTDIVNVWGASGTDPTTVANWTEENTPTDLVLTTSWKRYVIEDIDIDTGSVNNIGVFIWVDDTDAALNDELFLGQVQLNLGSKALPFQHKKYSKELLDCQRFFAKIIRASGSTQRIFLPAIVENPDTVAFVFITNSVPMRVVPTVSFSAGVWDVFANGGQRQVTAFNVTTAMRVNVIQSQLTINAGLAIFRAAYLHQANDAAYIDLDSEF